MSAITTHILDTSRGVPASGVPVVLEIRDSGGGWKKLGGGSTDSDGRLKTLLPPEQTLVPGVYRLWFDTGRYYPEGLYPEVTVAFTVRDTSRHYHIPLLLNPFGYTTYRGS